MTPHDFIQRTVSKNYYYYYITITILLLLLLLLISFYYVITDHICVLIDHTISHDFILKNYNTSITSFIMLSQITSVS